jgi:hemin uptake protein HemP
MFMFTSLTLVAVLFTAGSAQTPAAPTSLGTARLAQAVIADGKPLPAGTYNVRLTTDTPSVVVGQTPAQTRWVEFVKAGTVVGREIATVVPADDMKAMAKMPKQGGAVRVQTLKGGDYQRVWIVHAGVNYLIHLPVGTK